MQNTQVQTEKRLQLRRKLHLWFLAICGVKIVSLLVASPHLEGKSALLLAASFGIETFGLGVGILLVGRMVSSEQVAVAEGEQ